MTRIKEIIKFLKKEYRKLLVIFAISTTLLIVLFMWLSSFFTINKTSEDIKGFLATQEIIEELRSDFQENFKNVIFEAEPTLTFMVGGNEYDRHFTSFTVNGKEITEPQSVSNKAKIIIKYNDYPEDFLPFSFQMSEDAEILADRLREEGFTTVELKLDKSKIIEDKDSSNLLSLTLGKEEVDSDEYQRTYEYESINDGQLISETETFSYLNTPRYYPKDTKIVVHYAEKRKWIDLRGSLSMDDVDELESQLKKLGFTNIKREASEITLASEDKKVTEISYNKENIADQLPKWLPENAELTLRYSDYSLYQKRLDKELEKKDKEEEKKENETAATETNRVVDLEGYTLALQEMAQQVNNDLGRNMIAINANPSKLGWFKVDLDSSMASYSELELKTIIISMNVPFVMKGEEYNLSFPRFEYYIGYNKIGSNSSMDPDKVNFNF